MSDRVSDRVSESECNAELCLYYDVFLFCRLPSDHEGPHEDNFVQYRDESGKNTRVRWEIVE